MEKPFDLNQLLEWCRIPATELSNHPKAKMRIRVLPTPEAVYQQIAQEMADEVRVANHSGEPVRWILPCGPTGQYPPFIDLVNRESLSLRNVHVFHMDDLLDWQGRPLPLDHPFSFKGYMLRNFYSRILPDINVPEGQRFFPDPFHLDALSQAIEQVGGVDTAFGGIGYHGHIALNEPPMSPWSRISIEEYRASKTRVLHLNDDTIIAQSQRMVGGCPQIVPPMAVTIGMKDILSARRIRLLSTTGAWKQTVIRILLFAGMTTEYPVTMVQDHPDAFVTIDRLTAAHPLADAKLDLL